MADNNKLEILEIVGPIIKGDTWDGMELTLTENTVPIDLTNCKIVVDLGVKKFSSQPGPDDWSITVTNATAGVFRFDLIQNVDINYGTVSGILSIEFPGGNKYSYCVIELTVRRV